MPEKQYFKELNGYYVKDEEARNQINSVESNVDDVNAHVESLDNGKLKFHSVKGSSATYIVEFPNKKYMIIDSGTSDQWNDIKTAIDGLGINKFDYAVTTHFHADHDGNIQNLIDEYDFTQCTWYVGLKPDYINYSSNILDNETDYDDQITLLQSNGITPIVPSNNEYIVVDANNGVKLRFLNTDPTIASNYYSRYSERNLSGTDFNNFSLITEITHNDVKILCTGDIECPVEEQYASYLGKINVMTAPHHGLNRDANRAFYYGTMPDYAICSYPTASNTWAQPTYNELEYFKEIGTKVISGHSSIGVNGLFTFISDGRNVTTNTLYSAYTDDIFNFSRPLVHIGSICKNTSYSESSITLLQLLENMPRGSSLTQRWVSDYNTVYPQLVNDFEALFPLFNNSMTIELKSLYSSYEVKVYDGSIEFIAISPRSNINWSKRGCGNYETNITSQADLLTFLIDIPRGHYIVNYYKDTNGDSGLLDTSSGYALSIEKCGATNAMLTGVLKANATGTDKARAVFGYASGLNSTPAISWHKVNN